jgi:hypothetical protein
MRARHSILTASALAACALGLASASPAQAGDGYRDGPPQPGWKSDRHEGYRADGDPREAWLADCRHRMSQRGVDGASCEAILDEYHARPHGGQMAYGHPGYGYPAYGYPGGGYAGYGYGSGCCAQPMMMVPIRRISRGEPECTETVEEIVEYVDVPARARPRPVRPAPVKRVPDKRVKIVPDKRIKVK